MNMDLIFVWLPFQMARVGSLGNTSKCPTPVVGANLTIHQIQRARTSTSLSILVQLPLMSPSKEDLQNTLPPMVKEGRKNKYK